MMTGDQWSYRVDELEAQVRQLRATLSTHPAAHARLVEAARFIVTNRDKFAEYDPDGVKGRTLTFLAEAIAEVDRG